MSCIVTHNKAQNGIEIKFSAKPQQEILDAIKEKRAWRYHKAKKVWYTKYTEAMFQWASEFCEAKSAEETEIKPDIISNNPPVNSENPEINSNNLPDNSQLINSETITSKRKVPKNLLEKEIKAGKMEVARYKHFDGMQDADVYLKREEYVWGEPDKEFLLELKSASPERYNSIWYGENEMRFMDWKIRYKGTERVELGVESLEEGSEEEVIEITPVIQLVPNKVFSDTTVVNSAPKQTIEDLKAQYESKDVNELVALKKKLYSKMDIESAMSNEEKLLNEVIAAKYSEINEKIRDKRNEVNIPVVEAIAQNSQLPTPKSTYDLLINDNYFRQNPGDILGEEYIGSGQFGPETKVRGTIDNINVISSTYLQNAETEKPLETVVETSKLPTPNSQQESNIERAIKEAAKDIVEKQVRKKAKIGADSPELVPEQPADTISFDENFRTLNAGITPDEIESYLWYMDRIDRPFRGEWQKYKRQHVDQETITNWVKQGVLCFHNAELLPVALYCSENIADRISALRSDQSAIESLYGVEVYQNQERILNAVKPKLLLVNDPNPEKRLFLSPVSKFVKEFEINELEDGTRFNRYSPRESKYKEVSLTLFEAFKDWLQQLEPSMFENNTSSYEIVTYYLRNDDIRLGNISDKKERQAEKMRIQRRTKREAERLFGIFLREHITLEDRQRIEFSWNRTYNSYVPADFSKIPVAFTTASEYRGEGVFVKPEKREGVGFLSATGTGIIAYDVGVGKTWTAIFAIKQFLESGECKRPVLVVPNSTYEQWIGEIQGLLGKDIVINSYYNLGVGTVHKAKDESGNIKTVEEGSITLLTYEGLYQIGFNESTEKEIMSELYEILNQGDMKVRQTESFLMSLQTLMGKGLAGTMFNIEDFGFDFLCFDEGHRNKKSFTSVKSSKENEKNRFSISSGEPSPSALKAFMLSQFILRKNKMRNVVVLTATPFTNSPLEIYSMLALVGYQKLKQDGIVNLQDFFETFVKISHELVPTPKMTIERKEVILGFNNLITLQKIINKFILYKTGEDVGVERPDKWVLPLIQKRVNGELINLSEQEKISTNIPLSPLQTKLMKDIEGYAAGKLNIDALCIPGHNSTEDGAEKTSGAGVELSEAIMTDEEKSGARILKAVNYARGLAISPYLFSCSGLGEPTYLEYIEKSPKLEYIMKCVKSVRDYHIEKNEPVSGQIIYMDRGVDFFPLIKKYLIEVIGYKPHEVEIIANGTTAEKKEIIKNKYNGDYRNKKGIKISDEERVKVIIGSGTIKEGINLQKKTTVIYIACPDWNPTDMKQVEGRGWRFGNEFANIRIVVPIMENSIEVFVFEKLRQKQSRINEIWSKNGEFNDLKLEEFNPKELQASLITDPELLAQYNIQIDKENIDDEIKGTENTLATLEQIQDASKELAVQEPVVRDFVKKYRDLPADKEYDHKELIRLYDSIITTEKDRNGNSVYIGYSANAPIRSFKEAIRTINAGMKRYLTPKGIKLSDIDNEMNRLKEEILQLKKRKEEIAGEEAVKNEVERIKAERARSNYRSATVDERVAGFAKLNYLLSEKKIYRKAEPAKPVIDRSLTMVCPPKDANGIAKIDAASIEQMEKCIAREGQTKIKWVNADGEYLPERKKIHQDIINHFLQNAACLKREKPIAILTGGPPASGKSTILGKYAKWATSDKIYKIDADEVRAMLPEYKGWNAPNTHLETQDIVNEMLSQVGTCKHDVLYDGTMNKTRNYLPLLDKFKKMGYEVYILYLETEKEVALERSLARYQRTGRYVPAEVIEDFFVRGKDALDYLKSHSDGYVVISGITGELIEKGGKDLPADRNYDFLAKEDSKPQTSDSKLTDKEKIRIRMRMRRRRMQMLIEIAKSKKVAA